MEFNCGGTVYKVVFSHEEGIILDGQKYTAGNPAGIAELYAHFDINDPNTFERINYEMRGFLTKDTAYFLDKFPFEVSDITNFHIIK